MQIDMKDHSAAIAALLADLDIKRRAVECVEGETVFAQGDLANCVFCIVSGAVKLSVVSEKGKEAVVALLGSGDLFGEGSLLGQARRITSAKALMPTTLWRIPKPEMLRVLQARSDFAQRFLAYMLQRNIRIEEDLVDQLFNSTEKRLARALLLLARHGTGDTAEVKMATVPQSTLAEMVGTTRPRVNYFLNRFRTRGLIDYNGGLKVNTAKLNALLRE